MFPGSWSEARTLEEIAFSYQAILGDLSDAHLSGNEYVAHSIDNSIEIHLYLLPDNGIKSAFPKITE